MSLLTSTPQKRPKNSVRCATNGLTSSAPAWNAYSVVNRSRTCSPRKVHRERRIRLNPSLREFPISSVRGSDESDAIDLQVYRRTTEWRMALPMERRVFGTTSSARRQANAEQDLEGHRFSVQLCGLE